MKRLLTAAAIVTALTVSAFAEGDTAGSEAIGEGIGTARASTQDLTALQSLSGQGAMAQASIQPTSGRHAMASAKKVKGESAQASAKLKGESANASASDNASAGGGFFTPRSSGMDGGSRK